MVLATQRYCAQFNSQLDSAHLELASEAEHAASAKQAHSHTVSCLSNISHGMLVAVAAAQGHKCAGRQRQQRLDGLQSALVASKDECAELQSRVRFDADFKQHANTSVCRHCCSMLIFRVRKWHGHGVGTTRVHAQSLMVCANMLAAGTERMHACNTASARSSPSCCRCK